MCALARSFAVHLALGGRRCLVVGGGEVGWRKARALAECGARVTVVGERFSPALQRSRRVERVCRRFRPSDLRGVWLVVVATDDRALNRAVAGEADRRGLLVNVVDDAAAGNFIVPAQFRRGQLTVSISTEGASPLLACKVKERLGGVLGETYALWVKLLAEFRPKAQARVASARGRRRFFDELTSTRVYRILKREGLSAGRRYARQTLERLAGG